MNEHFSGQKLSVAYLYLFLKVKHFKENSSVGNGSANLGSDQMHDMISII